MSSGLYSGGSGLTSNTGLYGDTSGLWGGASGLAAGFGWSPARLFVSGEQGVWYDPSDLSTLFQDSAGTTPAFTDGDPVGLILDKSGNGNHATQATDAKRPVLRISGGRYRLEFDGATSNRALETAAIDLTGTDEITLCAGVHKASDTTPGTIAEFSSDYTANDGTFRLRGPHGVGTDSFQMSSKGTTARVVNHTGFASPVTAVLTGEASISPALVRLFVNGASGQNTAEQGTGNYGNHPLYIGGRAGLTAFPFDGDFYGFVLRSKLSPTSDIALMKAWMSRKTGAY